MSKTITKITAFIALFVGVMAFQAQAQGVFFSEYIEGSSNNKAIEIYNGTAATIDLANYQVVQANNGSTLAAAADTYKITLSGSLAAGEVYVIANGSANATILAQADLVLSYGDNPGDRVAAFNGDDAMGLYENGTLIDLFGNPDADPGSSWPVAGTGASANYTLVRKGSITQGNATSLASFGSDANDSEWVVYSIDEVSYLGYHTIDGQTQPLIFTSLDGFNGSFGLTAFGSSSAASSCVISASDLTGDLTIALPAGFEMSLTSDFSGTVYTATSALVLTPTTGTVAETTIYLRFTPTAADGANYSGDVTLNSDGASEKTIPLNGVEGVLTNDLFISQYVEGSASNKAIEIFNNSGAIADLSNYTIEIYANGASSSTGSLTLSDIVATLDVDGVLVIANGSSAAEILNVATTTTSAVVNFNGDDALVIKKNGVIIDVFGEIGSDPGSAWEVGGASAGSTANQTLVRKGTVQTGNLVGLGSFGTSLETSEWEILDSDDFTGLGSHMPVVEGGVFFSEYLEGSSNNKAIEIYNGTNAAIDLSNYSVVQANNGGTFAAALDPYKITLSGTLEAGDVYVIYNGAAAINEIISAGDLALSFGDNPGDRVVAFNGDDALGLFENGVLIDLFGDPDADPGSSWPVAGSGASANFTLVRKGTVMSGNIVALGSFGTNADDSEWIVYPIDEVSYLGAHAIATPTSPAVTLDLTGFTAAFGSLDLGTVSAASTYAVSAEYLDADLLITAPDGFKLSLDGTTMSSSLILTPTEGAIAATTVSVFFEALVEGTFAGDILHESTGSAPKSIAVSGVAADPASLFFEDFTSCEALNSFTAFSVTGDQVWSCTNFGQAGGGARMNGFSGGAQVNEDWLVTPAIDLTNEANAILTFVSDVGFSGPVIEVFASSNFTSDVTTATWVSLTVLLDESSDFDTWTPSGEVELTDFVGGNVFIGFKYLSDATNGAAQWTIDNVSVKKAELSSFFNVDLTGFNGDFGLQVAGTSSPSTSFKVAGLALTEDAMVTPPVSFEVSLNSDFTAAGTNSAPLVISPVDGVIADQSVYVRFVPAETGSFSGNIIVSTAGFDSQTVSVSGTGDAPPLSIYDQAIFNIYPNPVQNVLTLDTQLTEFGVEIMSISGVLVKTSINQTRIDLADLKAGIYIVQLKDVAGSVLQKQRIIKY